MTDAPAFDRSFWDEHWHAAPPHEDEGAANPYVGTVAGELPPGRVLDVGCGTGNEALELARHGWSVLGVDIAAAAITEARARAAASGLGDRAVFAVEDVTAWDPNAEFDLVMTNYAHADIGQNELYARIADWVAPGGTLLVVGHAGHAGCHSGRGIGEHGDGEHDGEHDSGHDGEHVEDFPESSKTDVESILERLGRDRWTVVSAGVHEREGRGRSLTDVVVRVRRLR